ncbi:hypothetical protein [Methylobacterium soli]|uniref:PspA/IM30 family protein n=1 Tax=Methylobacterium soli TaxID=553447 RepID=A0A6L3STH2_9HYPH|nr:hypothetical protein [Methylobacterium soli]KAB1072364.1 hypothetical protein F6X53_28150 [Methylobacterium soli]GJE46864.1 hypothetical protein AEGHOMDF_6073 [Methylobacterium soli]
MLKTLKSLIGINQKADAAAAEIEKAPSDARDEIMAAERVNAEADAQYRAGLLSLDDAEAQKIVADKQAATLRQDRAAALVEALSSKLALAQAAEVQARRRRQYFEATKDQAAAAKVLATEYPRLARSLAELLFTVAEADALAQVANEVLLAGVDRHPPSRHRSGASQMFPVRS